MSNCRFCEQKIDHVFVDLGMSPLCQTHISPEQLNLMEPFYPLKALVCPSCFLVQLDQFVSPDEIFSEYAYFSSYSNSWVAHAKNYVEQISTRFGLSKSSKVIEIASNDGYLLQHFVAKNIPVLGIEPAANVAAAAKEKGINSVVTFLGAESASAIVEEHGQADLVLGNNVLAHVPDINDFVTGIKTLMNPNAVLTMEFPHLEKLVDYNQYDTIYHEHFSYFSFITVEKIFAAHDITLFDVEELSTHGGSLRIYGCHSDDADKPVSKNVNKLRQRELDAEYDKLSTYSQFTQSAMKTKRNLLNFLIEQKNKGKTIVGYGAPGKGNTLLNYCGIRTDFLDYTVDRNPYKQGKYTPGTRIPILDPEEIKKTKPDFILILPWNLKDEIVEQNSYIRDWGGKFVVPIPDTEVI